MFFVEMLLDFQSFVGRALPALPDHRLRDIALSLEACTQVALHELWQKASRGGSTLCNNAMEACAPPMVAKTLDREGVFPNPR